MSLKNPMARAFESGSSENIMLDSKPMTIQGVINKSFLFLAVVVLSGSYTWNLMLQGFSDKAGMIAGISIFAGLILAIVTSFKPHIAKITGTAYALCEGLLLGAVSYQYQSLYNGIVIQAVGITLAIFFSLLLLFKMRFIRMTERLRKIVFTATFGIFIYYMICFIAGLLGHPVAVFNGGVVGIGISLFICVFAALNFIADFDFIERGSQNMLPDYYEWYGAFMFLVTLVWLYIEVLRLVAQLNSRE